MDLIKSSLRRMEDHFVDIGYSEEPPRESQVSELRRSFENVEKNFERLWKVKRELRLFKNAKRIGNSKSVEEIDTQILRNLINEHEGKLREAHGHAYEKFKEKPGLVDLNTFGRIHLKCSLIIRVI